MEPIQCPTMRKSRSLTESLRATLNDAPPPQSEIARRAELDPAKVWRFGVGEKRGITLDDAQKLAAALGRELVLRKPDKGTR